MVGLSTIVTVVIGQLGYGISVIIPDAEDSHVAKIESGLEESIHPAEKVQYSIIH